jgi:hypothetical protein
MTKNVDSLLNYLLPVSSRFKQKIGMKKKKENNYRAAQLITGNICPITPPVDDDWSIKSVINFVLLRPGLFRFKAIEKHFLQQSLPLNEKTTNKFPLATTGGYSS